jgi:hypothetical protein
VHDFYTTHKESKSEYTSSHVPFSSKRKMFGIREAFHICGLFLRVFVLRLPDQSATTMGLFTTLIGLSYQHKQQKYDVRFLVQLCLRSGDSRWSRS